MASYSKILFEKYFQDNSLVGSNIESFNDFVDRILQHVVDESKIIEPTIIPPNVESFRIRLDKIIVGKPEITEADGSKRPIYPTEARLRKISYAAPVYLEVSSHINDVQRESITTQIGSLPIMLKSKLCHLHGLNRDDLIEKGEDPDDPGGYFVINGTERVLVNVEDLAANSFTVEHDGGTSEYVGKVYSEYAALRVPHTFERLKDGVFYLSFTRVKRVPLVLVLKALGLIKDEDIMHAVSGDKQFDEVLINLFEFVNVKNSDDAVDTIAKKVGITQAKEVRMERMDELLDKYLLPHIGITKDVRLAKARNLCKMLKKFILISNKDVPEDDKDHYGNKRLKLAGDLLTDLFRVNLKVLIGDLLYNFQRLVKRGKFPSIKVIIREKLLTSRIYSAMATGNWVGARKGISQRMQRINHLDKMSHLQRVVSPLSASQENFAARELHATHLGRLCPCETPEGTNIGLRKNLAILAHVSRDAPEKDVIAALKNAGLREVA
ncbi:DNA-directed RNA polymerase subunit B'' [Candidatus Woesearchaeota archaeon]|nr:DNA-directed RNA polymerase subunit B'' [Candidatus Woesearchaeota archaeon]